MSRSRNGWNEHEYRTGADEAAPTGHWHLGMGSRPADKGYAGPGGVMSGQHLTDCKPEGGHMRPRADRQSGDPVIRDKANRKSVQAHASERYGPAGRVTVSRSYSNHSPAETGRPVRVLPSAKGFTDARRDGGR